MITEPVCETCNGEGRCMDMACYGGPVVEITIDCPDCNGTGKTDYETFRLFFFKRPMEPINYT